MTWIKYALLALLLALVAYVFAWPQAGGIGPTMQVYSCGTVSACAPTFRSSSFIYFGSVALPGGSPSQATITGLSPAFTSTSTYMCTVEDATSNQPTEVAKVSGSSFTIVGPANSTDTTNYICVGY